MIRYECDRCGAPLGENDPRRFIVKMEVYAATGRIDSDENDEADSGEALSALFVPRLRCISILVDLCTEKISRLAALDGAMQGSQLRVLHAGPRRETAKVD